MRRNTEPSHFANYRCQHVTSYLVKVKSVNIDEKTRDHSKLLITVISYLMKAISADIDEKEHGAISFY